MKSIPLFLAGSLFILGTAAPAAAHGGAHVLWDDFRHGWSVGTDSARWRYFEIPQFFTADDGQVTSTPHGLSVVAPEFTSTLGHEAGPAATLDRMKWLAYMNHSSSKGFPGFDTEPGREITCEVVLSGQIFGAHANPFGEGVVPYPDADPRLGTVVASAFDLEKYLIFNFLLTNEVIYAFYERAPFARVPGEVPYAAFTHVIPVAARCPYDKHRLKIAYDRSRGTVRWIIDGDEVFRVDTIGARLDRETMMIDRGGVDEIVPLDQMDCGMGMFTFLDGYGPGDAGLVQLDPDATSYVDPRFGGATPAVFLDPDSLHESRLFGQGAAMQVERYAVSNRRVP